MADQPSTAETGQTVNRAAVIFDSVIQPTNRTLLLSNEQRLQGPAKTQRQDLITQLRGNIDELSRTETRDLLQISLNNLHGKMTMKLIGLSIKEMPPQNL